MTIDLEAGPAGALALANLDEGACESDSLAVCTMTIH